MNITTQTARSVTAALLGTLLLASCSTTPVPQDNATPLTAQLLLPEEPICDATSLECPGTGGGGGSSFTYWTLGQVATIDARAAYTVNLALGSVAQYQQEYNQHHTAQVNTINAAPKPTNWDDIANAATPYAGLNWSQDGCSAPWYAALLTFGMTALYSQTFDSACRLHDFAYRNIGRFSNAAQVASGQTALVDQNALRAEVDARFRANMIAICEKKDWIMRGTCKNWANTFADAVRNHGQSSWQIWSFDGL